MNRVATVIVGLLVAVFGLLLMPGSAAPATARPVPVHTYDSPQQPMQVHCMGSERGPPEGCDKTTFDADGQLPIGTSARRNVSTPPAIYDYDDITQFVHSARGSRGAEQQVSSAEARSFVIQQSEVAANAVTRSLDDVVSLRGATTAEVEGLIPSGWVKSTTNANKGGLGIRYSNPERLGEQIRIMPGKVTDPNPLKQGPYMRISRNGTVTDPIPLFGNPTL